MHILLFGATGLVGAASLDMLINDSDVDKVTIISRKPVKQAEGHAKIEVLIQPDMSVFSEETLAKIKGAHGCIWALGPPYMGNSKEQYEYGHIDLPAIAAKILATVSDSFNFVYVSHDDCDVHEQHYVYAIKAKAERALLKLHNDPTKSNYPVVDEPDKTGGVSGIPSLNVYCVRPGGIDYKTHDSIKPFLKRLTITKYIANYVGMPIARYLQWRLLGTSQELGGMLVHLAKSDGKDMTLEGSSHGGRCIGVEGMRAFAKSK